MPPELPSFLDRVLARLQSQMRPEQYDIWFRGLALGEFTEEEIEYMVPTGFERDWLNRYYLDKIRTATCEELRDCGLDSRRIRITSDTTLGVQRSEQQPDEGSVREVLDAMEIGPIETVSPHATGSSNGHSGGGGDRLLTEASLNQDYTFEQFVVGPSNQLSHAASLAVGQNPGRAYNPLFIHGNVGLGKTHLLQSVCHSIQRRAQPARVVYLSCEEFTNRFIIAIQSGKLAVFRDYYRSADVLVIDDVQFLAGKDKTQEEFFHTFNALYNSQKQIVMSSDRSPVDIPTVQDRLVSRFKWGLVTDIQQPCYETRLAIVKRKALARRVDLDDAVAHFIADRITANIREVEGAVIKVIGVAAITDRAISMEVAEEALQGVASPRSNQITIPDTIAMITAEFSISPRDLTGKSRTQKISTPRQIAMFLAREYTDHSLEEIGRYFGNRDHTTVLYAVQKIRKRVKSDPMFRELLAKLSSRLESGSYRRSN